MDSMHYKAERSYRELRIKEIGEGNVFAEFIVNRGHKNGAERHVLTTTGIIIIYNATTKKMVTKLIARPGQIRRYYPYGGEPENIIKIAMEHQRKCLNL